MYKKKCLKTLDAAQILGVNANSLRQTFQDRQLTTQTFNNLRRGKYEPYFPSDDIRERFREIAKNLGTFDVYKKRSLSKSNEITNEIFKSCRYF